MTDKSLILSFPSPCGAYALVFDDDGKVAYAYLEHESNIVGDVWLYNRCATPDEPEWRNRELIPFALSREYVNDGARVARDVGRDDVQVTWEYEDEGVVAYVYIFEDLCGMVGLGDKPGYARFAAKPSRLAKVMEIED